MKTKQFSPNPKDSTTRRVVAYVLFAAEQQPNRAQELRLVAQEVFSLSRKPAHDSRHVDMIRNCIDRAREILKKEHGRALLAVPGMGIRATIDSGDALETDVEIKARRHTQATKRLNEAAALVKMSELKTAAQRARFDEITKACRLLTNSEVLAKLALPPKPKGGSSKNGAGD